MPFNLPGFILAQVRFHRTGVGGIPPADDVINTFAFNVSDVSGGVASVRALLTAFYTTPPQGMSNSIRDFMAKTLRAMTIVTRAADAPAGTQPDEFPVTTWVPPETTSLLPPDVAVCCSYRALPTFGRSGRGRIYLGPLNQGAIDNASGLVTPNFQTIINARAKVLAEGVEGTNAIWGIASRTKNAWMRINTGYVDDHFDTQRRRDPGTEQFGRHPDEWVRTP